LTRIILFRIFSIMTNLLHIDSSIRGPQSVSREMSAAFAEAWKAAHPDGSYTYRDLNTTPVPVLSSEYVIGSQTPADQRTPAQQAAVDATEWIRADIRTADVILLGVPMYNFTVPASLKAWLDYVIAAEFMLDDDGNGPLTHKKVVAVTARGGSYAPGTPREDFDFQEPLLRAILSQVGLDRNITFVHTEMVLSYMVEKLFQFQHIHDASKENAFKAVQELAQAS
jgi:FMN-dependent NADH-azoreductase